MGWSTSCDDHAACVDHAGLVAIATYLAAVKDWSEQVLAMCGPVTP